MLQLRQVEAAQEAERDDGAVVADKIAVLLLVVVEYLLAIDRAYRAVVLASPPLSSSIE